MPIGPPGSRQQEISNIQQLIIQKIQPQYGLTEANQLAQSYGKYADAHPNVDPKQAYVAWFLITSKLPNKLGKDLGTAIKSPGDLYKAFTKSVGALDIFNGINFGNWLMRGGEILIGIVLIGVGVAKLTGTQNIISSVVKAKI